MNFRPSKQNQNRKRIEIIRVLHKKENIERKKKRVNF